MDEAALYRLDPPGPDHHGAATQSRVLARHYVGPDNEAALGEHLGNATVQEGRQGSAGADALARSHVRAHHYRAHCGRTNCQRLRLRQGSALIHAGNYLRAFRGKFDAICGFFALVPRNYQVQWAINVSETRRKSLFVYARFTTYKKFIFNNIGIFIFLA